MYSSEFYIASVLYNQIASIIKKNYLQKSNFFILDLLKALIVDINEENIFILNYTEDIKIQYNSIKNKK